jgi:hypothetical protein
MKNWRVLNQNLNLFNEAEVKALLDEEIAGQRRSTFLKRLHQRYCTLRANRERAEIFSAAAKPVVGVQLDNAEAMHQVPSGQATN